MEQAGERPDPAGPGARARRARVQLAALAGLTTLALLGLGLAEQRQAGATAEAIELADSLHLQWVDRPAPEYDLPLLAGGRVRGGGGAGPSHGLLLVHFWASWCPTCLPELPGFVELGRRYGARGLQQLHVSLDEDPDAARRALPSGWDLPVGLDPQGQLAHAFGTEKLPEAYLIDSQGRVLLRFVANQPWNEARMQRLLEGMLR